MLKRSESEKHLTVVRSLATCDIMANMCGIFLATALLLTLMLCSCNTTITNLFAALDDTEATGCLVDSPVEKMKAAAPLYHMSLCDSKILFSSSK